MLMSMTTLPISGVSFLVCGLARICLLQRGDSFLDRLLKAHECVRQAGPMLVAELVARDPLWTIAMRVLPSVARELRQQPGEAALDGAERAMEQQGVGRGQLVGLVLPHLIAPVREVPLLRRFHDAVQRHELR